MVAQTLQELVSNPYAAKSYIVILKPYDLDAEAETTVYLSDRGYVSKPAESPANTYFEPRVVEALSFQRSMFSSGKVGGQSVPSFGEIVLANADGGLDAFAGYAWDNRSVEVLVGEKGGDLSEHFTIFKGQSSSVEFNDLEIRVILRDGRERFTRTLPPNSYAGTGGTEGSAIMEGLPKPICLGEVYNIKPVLVDEANDVYQVHDGQIEAIDAVYENGQSITGYTADLTNGRFTLTGGGEGIITADVRGAKPGGSYKQTVGELIRFVATEYGGFSDPVDIDTNSFADLDSSNSSPVGIYIEKRGNVLAVLDELANSVGAFYGFDRAGKLNVGRVEAPSGSPGLDLDSTNIIQIDRQPTSLPISDVVLKYKKNYTVLDDDTLSGSADDRDFALREGAQVEDSDASTAAIYPNATVLEVDSRLVDATAASAEASRLLALYGTQRDVYRVRVKTQPFTLKINDLVRVTFARYDLAAGKLFRVISLVEDAAINEVELELWG